MEYKNCVTTKTKVIRKPFILRTYFTFESPFVRKYDIVSIRAHPPQKTGSKFSTVCGSENLSVLLVRTACPSGFAE